MKKTLEYFINKKKNNQKITALTSYDYPTTLLLEKANIDMIILGDSVGTNILGYQNETEVTLNDMIHHTKAVCRAIKNIFLVVDLPYKTHETPENAIKNAKSLIDIGADAVKFEGIKVNILKALKKHDLNVMCHIGLGAGKYCDGQVLIINDLLGINEKLFRHVPKYINLREEIINILKRYKADTEKEIFPNKKHINIIKDEEYKKVEDWCIRKGFKI